jgi:hypothetical protein
LLGRLDLDQTTDILYGAAQQGGTQNAIRNLGALFRVVLEVQ